MLNILLRRLFAPLRAFYRWRTRPTFEIQKLMGQHQVDQNTVLMAMVSDLLVDRRRARRTKLLTTTMYLLMVIVPMTLYISFYAYTLGFRFAPGGSKPIVGVVRIEGTIAPGTMASADRVIPALKRAFEANNTKAVVVAIDSGGGSPVEAERMYRAIEAYRNQTGKPVVSVIGNTGASAAYMVALHTDRIYAAQYSLIGSIGAVLQGWDLHRALDKIAISQRIYASGNLKSMLNPFVPMSAEADRKAMELVSVMGRQFGEELASLRSGKLLPGVNYASGEVWGGLEAKRVGVIDEIGTIDDVVTKNWSANVQDFGPKAPELPLMSAATEWVRRALHAEAEGAGLTLR